MGKREGKVEKIQNVILSFLFVARLLEAERNNQQQPGDGTFDILFNFARNFIPIDPHFCFCSPDQMRHDLARARSQLDDAQRRIQVMKYELIIFNSTRNEIQQLEQERNNNMNTNMNPNESIELDLTTSSNTIQR